MDPLPAQLVLFDGVCGFCDLTVQWLLQHDRASVLRFAPLQGPTAAALRLRGARELELPSIGGASAAARE